MSQRVYIQRNGNLQMRVICRECFTSKHRNHLNEPIPRAARQYISNIKSALNRTRLIADKTTNATTRLQEISRRIEAHCDNVKKEIDKFIESYMEAIEQHRKKLHREVNEARVEKLHRIDQHAIDLQKHLSDIRNLLIFTDELMSEGTEVEVLSFIKPILQRLEIHNHRSIPELKISESLQFLPMEVASEFWNSCPLYGVVTTQSVAPDHCILLEKGLHNLRVGKRTDITLELRDRSDTPLQRGGEIVSAEIKHREAGSIKQLPLQVEDNKDGTYRISFTPEIADKYVLFVNVKNQPIKNNPFTFTVRPFRPHHGSFHCCSFCSSGGSKDATCGCGGKMPGGYKGCGHGHDGHPGRRHWSCCGNVLEHSECNKRNSTHYQFTL
ncbi:bonus isoform c-related [Holotrichia oblita]|uniref:Bonus isoform c-related n=1 Tax=Holotrichia oblita TaxID=644536 RepID=A0ACB9TDN7_HOLOL|nr:bonus isoform c-related [Holotrichia oblita]